MPKNPITFTALTLLAIASPSTAQQRKPQTGFDISRNLEVFADIYRQLDMFYVDTLSADTAVRWAIDGMLSEIDPYTIYYPGNDQDELRTMTTGRYAGIGAIIRPYKQKDRAAIEEPYEGSPAQEAGVRAGDVILTIDGKDIKGWPVAEVSKNLRGEPGTTFELRVQREGEKKPLAFKITRRQIQTPAVPWYGIVDDEAHIGYLYLSSVTDRCSRDVRYAITEMRSQARKFTTFARRHFMFQGMAIMAYSMGGSSDAAAVVNRAAQYREFEYDPQSRT